MSGGASRVGRRASLAAWAGLALTGCDGTGQIHPGVAILAGAASAASGNQVDWDPIVDYSARYDAGRTAQSSPTAAPSPSRGSPGCPIIARGPTTTAYACNSIQ